MAGGVRFEEGEGRDGLIGLDQVIRNLLSNAIKHHDRGGGVVSVSADGPQTPYRLRITWADGAAYDAQATKLAEMFRKNFEKFGSVAEEIRAAGPR